MGNAIFTEVAAGRGSALFRNHSSHQGVLQDRENYLLAALSHLFVAPLALQ